MAVAVPQGDDMVMGDDTTTSDPGRIYGPKERKDSWHCQGQ